MLHSSFKTKSVTLAKKKALRFHSANFLLAEPRSLVIQTHVQAQMYNVCKFGLNCTLTDAVIFCTSFNDPLQTFTIVTTVYN